MTKTKIYLFIFIIINTTIRHNDVFGRKNFNIIKRLGSQ